MPLSTVSAVLLRIGLGKRWRLEPPEPPNRYERARPGELVHIDVKKLGRIQEAPGTASPATARRSNRTDASAGSAAVGWEFVHVCVDDATRLAYVEVLADEKAAPRSASCAAPSPSTPPRHHRRARDDRQRRRPTAPPCTPSPAAHSASATCAPSPTDRAPTARPSASSAPCSAAGPTAPSTAPAENAPPPWPAGSGPTTTADHTAPSATSRPSPASHELNNLPGSYS